MDGHQRTQTAPRHGRGSFVHAHTNCGNPQPRHLVRPSRVRRSRSVMSAIVSRGAGARPESAVQETAFSVTPRPGRSRAARGRPRRGPAQSRAVAFVSEGCIRRVATALATPVLERFPKRARARQIPAPSPLSSRVPARELAAPGSAPLKGCSHGAPRDLQTTTNARPTRGESRAARKRQSVGARERQTAPTAPRARASATARRRRGACRGRGEGDGAFGNVEISGSQSTPSRFGVARPFKHGPSPSIRSVERWRRGRLNHFPAARALGPAGGAKPALPGGLVPVRRDHPRNRRVPTRSRRAN